MARSIYEVVCLNGKGKRYSIFPILVDQPEAENVMQEAKESGQYQEGDTIISVNALHEGGGISADSEVMGMLITVDSLQEAARATLDVVGKLSVSKLLRAADLVRLLIDQAEDAKKLLDALIEDDQCGELEKPILRLVGGK
jgi:hypothetical protein